MTIYENIAFTSDGTRVPVRNLREGVDHICVHSTSQSALGKILSPYARHTFHHPELGTFESLVGFFRYIKSGCIKERSRTEYGHCTSAFKCHSEYPTLIAKYLYSGIEAQYTQHPRLLTALLETKDLPLVNYHYFGNTLIDNRSYRKILLALGQLRRDYYDSQTKEA